MMTYDEVTKPSVLRLVVEVSRHWRVEPEQIELWRCVAGLHRTHRGRRHPLQVWAAHATGGHGKNLTSRVLVKESDQPFDYGALAFALGRELQRRLQFRVKEQFAEMWAGCGKTKRGWGGGCGSAVTYPLALFDGDTIFRVPTINDTYLHCDTLDGALRVFGPNQKRAAVLFGVRNHRLMMALWLGPKQGRHVPVAVANTVTLME